MKASPKTATFKLFFLAFPALRRRQSGVGELPVDCVTSFSRHDGNSKDKSVLKSWKAAFFILIFFLSVLSIIEINSEIVLNEHCFSGSYSQIMFGGLRPKWKDANVKK